MTTNYGYDSIYELLSATGGSSPESYTYDPVGNRLSSLAAAYTVNSSNEVTAASGEMYTYDANGNTTSKIDSTGTTNYTWDFENRLTSVTLPTVAGQPDSGGTVTFKYDPFGRRIYKLSPTATSIFAYDGDNLVETMNGTGGLVAHYTQGQNIDEPLAEQRSGVTDFYEADGLGSVTSLTASNGTVAQSYTYDSFGNTTSSSGSLTNFSRYTAREFDTETNLYYYRARYYDPAAGRFLSEDPIGFGGGIDLYAYVGNEPVGYLDPFGEIHYNKPPPATVPVTGQTLAALRCLEHCLQCITNNSNLNLLVTGGAEQSGHKGHSYHYLGQAVDLSFYNPVTTSEVFQCGENCGFTAGQAEPALHHWHLQLTPGNGVKLLPAMLPMSRCGNGNCQ